MKWHAGILAAGQRRSGAFMESMSYRWRAGLRIPNTVTNRYVSAARSTCGCEAALIVLTARERNLEIRVQVTFCTIKEASHATSYQALRRRHGTRRRRGGFCTGGA